MDERKTQWGSREPGTHTGHTGHADAQRHTDHTTPVKDTGGAGTHAVPIHKTVVQYMTVGRAYEVKSRQDTGGSIRGYVSLDLVKVAKREARARKQSEPEPRGATPGEPGHTRDTRDCTGTRCLFTGNLPVRKKVFSSMKQLRIAKRVNRQRALTSHYHMKHKNWRCVVAVVRCMQIELCVLHHRRIERNCDQIQPDEVLLHHKQAPRRGSGSRSTAGRNVVRASWDTCPAASNLQ